MAVPFIHMTVLIGLNRCLPAGPARMRADWDEG